jgi:Protein of unknown function (DUF4241)
MTLARSALAVSLLLLATFACAGAPAATPVTSTAERGGMALEVALSAGPDSLVVTSQLENEGSEPVHVVPTQCGRVMEALLARTIMSDEGHSWGGSVGALKELVLDRQEWDDRPDRFEPRRPGDASSATPECVSPEGPAELAPGAVVEERWELPFRRAETLADVGSAASYVRVEAVEARSPEHVEFLDFEWEGMADDERAGRNVRVELPVEQVLQREPSADRDQPLGLLFDLLMEDPSLRAWIEAQPEDGWRQGDLNRAGPSGPGIGLRAITTAYERPLVVSAEPDGTAATLTIPTEADRTRVFERRPATLPPGVEVLAEPEAGTPTEDVLPGTVRLPSGRAVVAEVDLYDAEALSFEVAPGAYPAHATIVRYPDSDVESVALLSLVLSDAPTVRWEDAGGIAVDGGTTTITSPEGVAALEALLDPDREAEWWARSEAVWDSLTAHDHLATEADIDGRSNLVMSSSGLGDGVYGVAIGFDAAGEPTRVVVDFLLIHLDWEAAFAAGS